MPEFEFKTRERDIEAYLRDQTRIKLSGTAYKFVSPGNTGVPDRFLALPIGFGVFVELKAPGKKSTEKQKLQQARLKKFGFIVFADIDSKEKVDQVIDYCADLIKRHRDRIIDQPL